MIDQLKKFILNTKLEFNDEEINNICDSTDIINYIVNILKNKKNIFMILNDLKLLKYINSDGLSDERKIIFTRMYNEVLDIINDTTENLSSISIKNYTRSVLEKWLIFKNLTDGSDDEQNFKFNIYKISGFMNRHEYPKNISITTEVQAEIDKQKNEIIKSYDLIKNTNTYKNLTKNNKDFIDNKKIKKEHFKPYYSNNKWDFNISWTNLLKIYSKNHNLYDYLSYKIHPSYLNFYQSNNNTNIEDLYFLLTLISNFLLDFDNYLNNNILLNFEYLEELKLYKGF